MRPVLVLIYAFIAALLPGLSIGKSENRSIVVAGEGPYQLAADFVHASHSNLAVVPFLPQT
jgi:hypothetical protein